jgi:head-tail adaptor
VSVAVDKPQNLSYRDLRDQIVFQRKTVTGRNAYNEETVAWTTLLTAHAYVYALQGRELERVQQKWAEARFGARLSAIALDYDLRRADRVLWGTRSLDLLDIEDPFGTNQWAVAYLKDYVE